MKLQRTTWILVGFALILGGGVYFAERQGTTPTEAASTQDRSLFDFEESQVQTLIVEREDDTLEFERTEDNSQPWQMTDPETVSASEPAIAFLLNFLIEPQIEHRFTSEGDRLSEYGLDDPFATITVTTTDQEEEQTLVLGQPNFDGKFLYALINTPEDDDSEVEVFLVPYAVRYAVEREYEEWKLASEEDTEAEEENTEAENEEEATEDEEENTEAEKEEEDTP